MKKKSTTVHVLLLNPEETGVWLVKNKEKVKILPSGRMFLKPQKWGMPGGRKRDNENEVQAALREVKEETGGLEANILTEPIYVKDHHQGSHRQITFVAYTATKKFRRVNPVNIKDDDILACRFFLFQELPSLKIYKTHRQIMNYLLKRLNLKKKIII